jgi:hypothetical protein
MAEIDLDGWQTANPKSKIPKFWTMDFTYLHGSGLRWRASNVRGCENSFSHTMISLK